MKATKFGLLVFTGKNYFLIEFAALSKNALDKMSEIFVNKALIRDVFHLQKKYIHFKPAALISSRELQGCLPFKKEIPENPIGK